MTDLLAATAELVAIPSLSRHEGQIADHVEAELRRVDGLEVVRVGDNVVARTDLADPVAWLWPATLTPSRPRTTVPPKSTARPCGGSARPI